MPFLAQASAAGPVLWPFAILFLCVGFIVLAIMGLRFHAFLALILTALLAGLLTPRGNLPAELSQLDREVLEVVWGQELASQDAIADGLSGEGIEEVPPLEPILNRLVEEEFLVAATVDGDVRYQAAKTRQEVARTQHSHPVHAIETVATDFGRAAGGIGVVIALAAIIGMCLMESGAADMIVRRFMALFGEARAALALMVSGFFLSIPVFFDTVFFLLIPLARAMGMRTGRNYMLYVMAIGGGGAITHSIVPPTPGPLLVGDALNLQLGVTIMAGAVAGIIPAICALYFAKWLDRRMPIPLREVAGASLADLDAVINKKEEELPGFWLSMSPVLLPVLFIALASVFSMMREYTPDVVQWMGGEAVFGVIYAVIGFLGNKIIALLLGALLAMAIYWRQAGLSLAQLGEKLGPPLETAGVIILITSAGGAFGAMIRHAGVGGAIKSVAEGYEINYILLAWLVTAVVRVAQGSATVSMITGAGLMAAVIGDGSGLPYHPLYIYLAIGFGSMLLSWMNDSGFWVVGKLSGFTEKETLKSWTVQISVISVIGLIETLIFAKLLPFSPQ